MTAPGPAPRAASGPAGRSALADEAGDWSRDALDDAVRSLGAHLASRGVRVLATWMDNSPAWVVADRAALAAGLVHVPIPLFFTSAQAAFALDAAGVDAVLAAAPAAQAAPWSALPREACPLAGRDLVLVRRPGAAPGRMPAGTAKITFTSGSTGAPKGVCLSAGAMQAVAAGLQEAMAPLGIERHLCALPLAVLLENIAGTMAPLALGATCIVPSLEQVGLAGSSRFDPARFHAAVAHWRPHSVILLPQMLRAWTAFLEAGRQAAPDCLRLVAVGGAAVGAGALRAARAAGIPAYEGYGLSEGASVQTLNLPGADRPGSAGRVLPHARLRIADDGGIEVGGSLLSGYLGAPGPAAAQDGAWFATGDIGRIDADGFLHIEGRRTNLLITAYGRNVSPEWVETALRAHPAVAQAVVLGEGRPALGAVLWPVRDDLPDTALQAAVDAANAELPDYARVRHWARAAAPFDASSGLATANGRPRRAAVRDAHPRLFPPSPAPGAATDQPSESA